VNGIIVARDCDDDRCKGALPSTMVPQQGDCGEVVYGA